MADVNAIGGRILAGLFDATPVNSITLCPATIIHTTGITAFADHLEVTFDGEVSLSGPALEVANWFVTVTGAGNVPTISSVEFDADTVTLGISPQTLDAVYTLHLPTVGISSTDFLIFTGLFSIGFLGVPTVVDLQMVRAVDTHHVDVIFGIAVTEETAGDINNYSVDNDLTITEAVRITDYWYRLRNEPRQTDGVDYTFTATNIEAK